MFLIEKRKRSCVSNRVRGRETDQRETLEISLIEHKPKRNEVLYINISKI